MITRHPLNTAVAAELAGYLKAAGMTQEQLAAETGMAQGVVQRYLAGTRDIQIVHIAKIADALGFEPSELLNRASARLAKC